MKTSALKTLLSAVAVLLAVGMLNGPPPAAAVESYKKWNKDPQHQYLRPELSYSNWTFKNCETLLRTIRYWIGDLDTTRARILRVETEINAVEAKIAKLGKVNPKDITSVAALRKLQAELHDLRSERSGWKLILDWELGLVEHLKGMAMANDCR